MIESIAKDKRSIFCYVSLSYQQIGINEIVLVGPWCCRGVGKVESTAI